MNVRITASHDAALSSLVKGTNISEKNAAIIFSVKE